ncbi:mitochondrial basic amino acids transporter [Calliopsis andreniformis]|uniref:mitochondrial basic amino acids transporter n=1 Tax=Calliopsis andreniformis TaxID=337506 RepID=UPI003FCDA8BB
MALDYVAGCLGGCAGIMVGYPLDTVKVHMQTQDYRNPKYKGSWHCFRTLLAKESVAGLYRGMTSPMAGVAVVNAIVFGVYGQTQKQIPDSDRLSSHFIAGALAGMAQSPICGPIELAKTRMQLQALGIRFSGPLNCLKHIYRHEGYRGVFKGLSVTFLREMPSFGVYFLTYEALTRTFGNGTVSTPYMLLAGGLAGTTSWVVSYPLDVVKSRIQSGSYHYAGIYDCLRQSVRSEGYSCLYRGLNSTILRAFPTNAVTFTVVTWTFRLLGDKDNEMSKMNCEPKLGKSVRQISEVHEPILKNWDTFLTDAAGNLNLRTAYSMLSMTSTNNSMLGSSTFCEMNKYNVKIKYSMGEEGRGHKFYEKTGNELGETKINVDQESNKEGELADVEQTIAIYSFDSSHITDVSDIVSCF